MAAFVVTPIIGVSVSSDSDAFVSLAMSVAGTAFLIVGVGISPHIVERKTKLESQARLQHVALHDALTKGGNRRGFSEALNRECKKLERYGRPFALFVVDLDRFKPINDA